MLKLIWMNLGFLCVSLAVIYLCFICLAGMTAVEVLD